MDKTMVNTAIIDDAIEKLERIKESEKISVMSYTRLASLTSTTDNLLNVIEEKSSCVMGETRATVDFDR